MCADGYNWAPNKPGTRYESFQELFQAFYNWSLPHNKPLMVGETGVQENNPGDKAKWIAAMHVSLTQHYPNIVAWLYFDTQNANGLNNEWWLESDPQSYQAWKDMAADPYFNHKDTLVEAPYGHGSPAPGPGPSPDPGPAPTPTPVPDPGADQGTGPGHAVALGDAAFLGDVSRMTLNGPVLGSVATPSGKGYYMVASDGGIFAFGDAHFVGSMGGKHLNAPVESLVPDGDGTGYWLVASDGGIFSFDAPFKGSMGEAKLAKPITGIVRYGHRYLMSG